VQQYRHAIAVVDELLGSHRRTELSARGRAIDDAESTNYALAVIERALASEVQ
jgi:hypothetical protein